MTQYDLSKALQISPSAIGMYETGKRSPDYDTLKKISRLFDVSIDYLLDNNYPFTSDHDSVKINSPDEIRMIRAYRFLNSSKRSAIDNMIQALSV